MRRSSALQPSRGTVWPPEVREHVAEHQRVCLGPLAGMPGECRGAAELDHVRASGGLGMKSASVAVNAAWLCNWHHWLKGQRGGRTGRACWTSSPSCTASARSASASPSNDTACR